MEPVPLFYEVLPTSTILQTSEVFRTSEVWEVWSSSHRRLVGRPVFVQITLDFSV
jgi:hypothetical protein